MTTVASRRTRILNVSLPPEMYEAISAIAQAENRTKSELIREAFRHYQFVRRWRLIRQWAASTPALADIHTDEELEQFLG